MISDRSVITGSTRKRSVESAITRSRYFMQQHEHHDRRRATFSNNETRRYTTDVIMYMNEKSNEKNYRPYADRVI